MNRSEGQWTQPELSIPVTRGIRTNRVDTNSLGSHWTTDPGVADYFQNNGTSRMPFKNTASIDAEIPLGSIETDTNTLNNKRVGGKFTQNNEGGPMNEGEITARSGAPIKVKSITTIGPKKPTRISKAVEEAVSNVPISVDYQRPGDSEIEMRAYDTLQRRRTRRYNPPREMKA